MGSNRAAIVFIAFFLLFNVNSIFAQDTLFYNQAWKPCKKKNAAFMRTSQVDLDQINVIDYYYPSKKIQMTGTYSKIEGNTEIENGFFQYFSNEGIKKSSGVFIQGKKEGNWKYFYPNGKVFQSWNFKEDQSNGTCYTYYLNGRIMKKEEYRSNELLQQSCMDEFGKEMNCSELQSDSLSIDNKK